MTKKKTPSKPKRPAKQKTGGGCPEATCYAVFVRKAGNWTQESVPFDSYAEAQSHAKLTRRARPFVEMTRVRRLPHNKELTDR